MSDEISMVCPYCAEPVKTAAKICPWCRQWLSLFSLRNPAVFVMIFYFCMVVVAFGFFIFLQRMFDPGINFSPYRDSISIVESRMNLEDAGKDSSVHVVAVITNQTDIAWKQVQLDVRFFNKAGALIDARVYHDVAIVVPHGESAFRINTKPSYPLSDYDSYKLYIRSARDARCKLPY